MPSGPYVERQTAAVALRSALKNAIRKHLVVGYEHVAVLASGGLDSSAVAALANEVAPVVLYTVGFDGSRDLACARALADRLRCELKVVSVPDPTDPMLQAVVGMTGVSTAGHAQIAWATWHVAAAMAMDGVNLVLTGQGPDELFAAYGTARHALREKGWDECRRDLVRELFRVGLPRSDRVFAAYSIACLHPFAEFNVVDLCMSMPEHVVRDGPWRPKQVLVEAVRDLLPPQVLHRPKLAFQEGAGLDAMFERAGFGDSRWIEPR